MLCFKVTVIYPKVNVVVSPVRVNIPVPIYVTRQYPANVSSACATCSFGVVARRMSKYLKEYYNIDLPAIAEPNPSAKIFFEDLYFALSRPKLNALYSVDTPFVASSTPLPDAPKVIMSTSWHTCTVAKTLGTEECHLVPRSPDDKLADAVYNRHYPKEYDVVAVITQANTAKYKNYALVKRLVDDLKLKAFLVCDAPGCNARTFSMSDEDLHALYAKAYLVMSMSSAEGFAMPPAEAMSVGTPVIHFDTPFMAHPFSSSPQPYDDLVYDAMSHVKGRNGLPYADTGLRKDPVTVYYDNVLHYTVPITGMVLKSSHLNTKYFYDVTYDYDEVKRAVRDALDDIKSRDVEKVREQLHEYAVRRFYHSAVIPKYLEVMKKMGLM